MVAEQGSGIAEKAMVVLSSLAGTDIGKNEIVVEGGIPALVEAIEDGSMKGEEFSVVTLLQFCSENVRNRGLLVREGVLPPLVVLSQSGAVKAKHTDADLCILVIGSCVNDESGNGSIPINLATMLVKQRFSPFVCIFLRLRLHLDVSNVAVLSSESLRENFLAPLNNGRGNCDDNETTVGERGSVNS